MLAREASEIKHPDKRNEHYQLQILPTLKESNCCRPRRSASSSPNLQSMNLNDVFNFHLFVNMQLPEIVSAVFFTPGSVNYVKLPASVYFIPLTVTISLTTTKKRCPTIAEIEFLAVYFLFINKYTPNC